MKQYGIILTCFLSKDAHIKMPSHWIQTALFMYYALSQPDEIAWNIYAVTIEQTFVVLKTNCAEHYYIIIGG